MITASHTEFLTLPPVRRDFKFVAQIRDAARGGTRNIAEGYSRFVPREIVYFLSIAKSSLDEAADELIDGLESGYWTRAEYNTCLLYTSDAADE